MRVRVCYIYRSCGTTNLRWARGAVCRTSGSCSTGWPCRTRATTRWSTVGWTPGTGRVSRPSCVTFPGSGGVWVAIWGPRNTSRTGTTATTIPARRTACTGSTQRRRSCRSSRGSSRSTDGPRRTAGTARTGTRRGSERRRRNHRSCSVPADGQTSGGKMPLSLNRTLFFWTRARRAGGQSTNSANRTLYVFYIAPFRHTPGGTGPIRWEEMCGKSPQLEIPSPPLMKQWFVDHLTFSNHCFSRTTNYMNV